jgi:hypothetical protein
MNKAPENKLATPEEAQDRRDGIANLILAGEQLADEISSRF